MIKVVLFDFDGVIGDTIDISLECINKLADREGYNRIKIEDIRHRNLKDVLRKDFKFSYFKIYKYTKYLRTEFKSYVKDVKVFSGVDKVISDLKEMYRIDIVTSNSKDSVCYILDKNGIRVDSVFSGVSLFGKQVVFKKLLKKLKLKKEEVVYIGDEIRDVEACKKAGIKMIGVGWGYNSRESLKKYGASWVVDKPSEILEVIR